MFKLFTNPGSCSTACSIVAEELGIQIDRKFMSSDKGDYSQPEFLTVNPKGYTPVLEIAKDVYLTEGSVIMQFMADQKPEANLLPRTGIERYKVLEWLNFVGTELHASCYNNLFTSEYYFKDEKTQGEFETNVKSKLNDYLSFVNKNLEGKTFIANNQYSIADAYLYTVLSWSKWVEVDLTNYRNITSYMARIFERAGTQKAMKAEGLIK